MQKTKLGISVGLMGAILYFVGLFSGYVAITLLVGYVLLCEENMWLKKAAVKALAVMMLFSFASAIINLIPNFINFIDDIAIIFGGNFYISIISKLVNMIVSALNILQKLLLLILGVKALNQGTITVPVVDNLINKYMG